MTTHTLVLVFTVGAALLAGWIHCRLPERAPETAKPVFAHVLAGLLGTVLVPVLMALLETQDSPIRAMAALFLLFLPALVYCFLSWIWLLGLVQQHRRFE
jgi:uncharacterized membrane protein YeaQ/YmgE (transglycosylase-associated protein family)